MLKKKWLALALTALCAAGPSSAYAAVQTNALSIEYANSMHKSLEQSDYVIRQGRIYVSPLYLSIALPIQTVSKGIDWHTETQTLSISAYNPDAIGERSEGFTIKAGERAFQDHVRDERYEIAEDLLLANKRVYLPLRAIAEAYGYSVEYDAANRGKSVIRITGESDK
ncbi:stalk domain-containing protein [Paenibacillus aurantiacus]|uniref:Stalk domain-containing protein n=1 Tax=Paenibacillus aurantiacus TaxID=1936118 RepID=A0ABV5KY88_9BACL